MQKGKVHGDFQIDMQYYNEDSLIGAPDVSEQMLMNAIGNFNYTNGKFAAGFRYESYLNPLQGFDPRLKGSGIMYRYASYTDDFLSLTVGSFYEQFGNGLILRTYEDRFLGFDNALDGLNVTCKPTDGVILKAVWGKQRQFFDYGPGIVRGADAEFQINQLIKKWKKAKTQVLLGGSFVSKYQEDNDPVYILPENVASAAGRFNIIHSTFNLNGEYAYKVNDPSLSNNYIYNNGQAILISTSFYKKQFGISFSTKWLDNFDFRSDRTATGNALTMNYIPPLNKQHTYSLAAMYPYAVQPTNEFGFQGELKYKLKKKTWYGGKYGTIITLNYSMVKDIKIQNKPETPYTPYTADIFDIGNITYFSDANIEISRKINKKWKFNAQYINLVYNKEIVQGLKGYGTVYANAGVLDITYKPKSKHAIRLETQTLQTKQDEGNWLMGMVEYTMAPHWFFAVLDQYNYNNPHKANDIHYYSASMGYIKNTHRIAISYGRQRAGIICVGGVCRNVPASNGVTISISSSF